MHKLKNNRKEKSAWVAMLLVFMLSFGSVGETLAYYMDEESSKNNIFVAGNVDFELENQQFTSYQTSINMGAGDSVYKNIIVDRKISNPFKYEVEGKNFTGDTDFCEGLNANMKVETNDMYNGGLMDLLTSETEILDTWELTLSLVNSFENKICMFDTEYRGSQTRHNYPLMSAYNDTESVSHKVKSWGFRINKIYYDVESDTNIPAPTRCDSGVLDPNALVAGADDDNVAFDYLNISNLSTVGEAFSAVEAIRNNSESTAQELGYADYVEDRIYLYYSSQSYNAYHPYCVYPERTNDAKGSEGNNEWVEIYNQTDTALDISGWKICDNSTCDTIPANTPLIPAKGFAVITAKATTWSYWEIPSDIVKIVLGTNIGDGLNNDNDMLVLKRPDGVIVDQMNYGANPDPLWPNYNADIWNPGSSDVPEGHMLGRKPNGYDTDQASDFVDLALPMLFLTNPVEKNLVWDWDTTYEINWEATNPNGPDEDITINLFYIKDTDQSGTVTPADETILIDSDLPNTGSHFWTVPGSDEGFLGYIWIKVVAVGPENPMLNVKVISKRIWDPYEGYINDLSNLFGAMLAPKKEEEMIVEELAPAELPEDETLPMTIAPEGNVEESTEEVVAEGDNTEGTTGEATEGTNTEATENTQTNTDVEVGTSDANAEGEVTEETTVIEGENTTTENTEGVVTEESTEATAVEEETTTAEAPTEEVIIEEEATNEVASEPATVPEPEPAVIPEPAPAVAPEPTPEPVSAPASEAPVE